MGLGVFRMSYVLPQFNLLCNVSSGVGGGLQYAVPGGLPRLTNLLCALVYGTRVNVATSGGTGQPGVPVQCMSLLVPAFTDVRGLENQLGSCDAVECPSGSGRWYSAVWVDDIGKGWPNEHRTVMLLPMVGVWFPPYP